MPGATLTGGTTRNAAPVRMTKEKDGHEERTIAPALLLMDD